MAWLDMVIVGVRLVLLIISLMGLIRFGPYLLGSLCILRPKKCRCKTSHANALYLRRGSWAFICITGILFTVEFFDRVYFSELPSQVLKGIYLAAMTGFTFSIAMALVSTAIEDWGDKLNVSASALAWVHIVFMVAAGLLGVVALHF